MDELVEWLRAQLDEDERIARRAGDTFRQIGETGVIVATEGDRAEECASANWAGVAEHIVTHDPARVRRDIDANRRRLERHTPTMMVGYDSNENDPSTYVLGCPTCQVTVVHEGDWPCEEVRDMLVSFADRPGYREDWRP
ncbi:DUF6221 family protein [Streptomyces sp. NPDC047706]|uniref:DUF6221 family protein n=1 Tax=Streptomyces sp. NPDC047706 TaxID=3365486 RepID=UPI0037243DD6